MSALITIVGCCVSLWALRAMMRGDAKRMRVVGGTAVERTRRGIWFSRFLLWCPGVVLVAMGDAAGFVIWLGALTAFGWAMVAMPHLTRTKSLPVAQAFEGVRYWVQARRYAVRRIIEMPARLERMELALADMQRELETVRAERGGRAA